MASGESRGKPERMRSGQAKGRRLPLGKRPWQLERIGGGFRVAHQLGRVGWEDGQGPGTMPD